jgi:hypothetical protein
VGVGGASILVIAVAAGLTSGQPETEAFSVTTEAVVEEAPETTQAPTTTEHRACEFGETQGRSICINGSFQNDPDYVAPTTVPTPTIPPTTTPPAPAEGTRSNPFDLRPDAPDGTDVLSNDEVTTWAVSLLSPGDPVAIHEANQFNDEAGPGLIWMKVFVYALIADTVTEPVSPYSLSPELVGDKGKVYENAFISDSDGFLSLLNDQPDTIGGGSVQGYVYYLVDADDANFLVLMDDNFIIPG